MARNMQDIYDQIRAEKRGKADPACAVCGGSGQMKVWDGHDPALADCYCIGGRPARDLPSSCGHD